VTYDIDPELAAVIEGLPILGFENPAAVRETMTAGLAAFAGTIDESSLDIEDRTIPGLEGSPELVVRVYRPKQLAQTTAGLLYIHGGGFAVGDLDSEHAVAVQCARELGIVVVSVDYRLAPEHPFPAGLEDCYAALQWFHANTGELQVDPTRIAIRGGSAGAGLSAGLALMAKERGGPAICFQFLGIPELDDRLNTVSMTEFTDTPLWHRPNAILSWKYYLEPTHTPGADDVPIQAAPARASIEDLRGLPPAYVTTMEFDPLRDEGISYALKLLQAGVSVELHSFPRTFHGSEMMSGAQVSKRGITESLGVLRRALSLD
jgi:acetyl esterase/lipase